MTVGLGNLRCEHLVEALGIGTATPRLSWSLAVGPGSTDVVQDAWQVQVGIGDDITWDTGRVEGWQQCVRYSGPRLASRSMRWWRAQAWSSAGPTGWSEPSTFELGLIDPSDWSAAMITATASTPVMRFASSVDVNGDVVRARLYLTAHGAVVATLNGQNVGDEVLAPGWTSYANRLAVRTHDVTALVRSGPNELAAVVAPGWFSGRIGFDAGGPIYGRHVGVLAQLEVTTADGATAVLASDSTWTATSTPFLLAEIYDGETYDATRPAEAANIVTVDGFDHSVLVSPSVPPVRRTGVIAPVATTVADDGAVLVDMGQNLVGRLRLRLRDVTAGTEVAVRHAEVLGPDGRLFTAPLRTAEATDRYIAIGGADEVYEPTFTFHGFRYAEITGVDVDSVSVDAVVVHSDLDRRGSFACSDPLIERLHENVVWSQRGNFLSIPTDCPQRDERLGWTGDAQVFSPTASYLYDCETFWEAWLADLAHDQRSDGAVPHVVPTLPREGFAGAAGWGDAAVVVPWTTYEAYGDPAVLRQALPSMTRWVDYVHSRLDDDLRWSRDFQFGDWLDPDAPTSEPWRAKAKYDLVATAYAAFSTALLARAARVLGEHDRATMNEERAKALRDAWWARFGAAAAATQTGCALAIEFDLAPDEQERQRLGDALAALVRQAGDHLTTGFLGTPLLLPALTKTGHLDVAYDLLHQDGCPSWLYQVRAGATTIWERWDALRPDGSVPLEALGTGSGAGMVSFNHYAYGSVGDWLHRTVVGLAPDPEDPGYHHVVVAPRPGGGLTSASGELETRFGRTAVGWQIDGGQLLVDVVIPPNARATVTLPGAEPVAMGSGGRRFAHPWPA